MSTNALERFYVAAGQLDPADRLVARVLAQASSPSHRRARRRRLRVAFAILGAAALALTATALAETLGVIHLSNPGRQLLDANALRTKGLPSELGAPESTQLFCNAPGRITEAGATGEDPRAICAALWRKGIVTGTKQEPPALQACVATNGTINVYPGANACAAMGRPVAKPYTPEDIQAIKLEIDLRAWIDGTPRGCATADEGVARVTAMLRQRGLDDAGWRIAIDDAHGHNADDGKPCLIPTAFQAKKIVLLS